MQRKNIRSLSLIVCTFTYLMIGAAMFDAFESEMDNNLRGTIDKLEKKLKDKYKFSEKDYEVLEAIVIKSQPYKAGYQWKFAGAFYFATVVITTVGYGHSTPGTKAGRIFCMIYAFMGIPLGLVMFQSIGERLNTFISYALHKIRKQLLVLRVRDITPTHLLSVSFSLGGAVIALGTYVFHVYEDWNIFEAYYYCIITLTTIGLGDYVALQTDKKLQKTPGYVVFTLLFILFGLAIFSAGINLFVLRFMATNTDADTSDKDLPKTVVLESFGSGENSDDDDMTPNGSALLAKHSIDHPKQATMLVEKRTSESKRQKTITRAFGCAACFMRKKKSRLITANSRPINYTVRRSATPQIGHLLSSDTPDSPGAESFLLHDLPARRLST